MNPQDILPYITYGTYPMQSNRARAAKTRNYNNCTMCKQHRQKCDVTEGAPCLRCRENKYKCSLLDDMTPSPSSSNQELENFKMSTEARSVQERDKELFGEIVYALEDNAQGITKVFHIPLHPRGDQEVVYLTVCDNNFTPKSEAKYVDLRHEFERSLCQWRQT